MVNFWEDAKSLSLEIAGSQGFQMVEVKKQNSQKEGVNNFGIQRAYNGRAEHFEMSKGRRELR